MKYIDAERLKAEIHKRKKSLRAGICGEAFTRKQKNEMLVASEELDRFNRIIDSLHQEQPGVEQDIANVVKSYLEVQELDNVKITITGVGLLDFAKHIKKIVLNSAFILYNQITDNSGNKTLDDEIDAIIKMNDLWGGLLPNTLIKYTSRHFYELGKNSK